VTFPPPWRRLVLLLHVATSVGFIGAIAAFLVLAIAGANGTPSVYVAMQLITWPIIVPLAFASLLIGIVSSLGTPWGLVRYYWLIAKLGLTVVAVIVLMLQTRTIDALAASASAGSLDGMAEGQRAMVLHASGGLVVILLATVLSVYKPRGVTRWGQRSAA
jgi:hypothetical protein